MRKAIVAVLCVVAFAATAMTLRLHTRDVLAAGWTDWSLGYILGVLPFGASLLLLAVALVPWVRGRAGSALALAACLLAWVAACYMAARWCAVAAKGLTDVSVGESIGWPAVAVLSVSCFLRLRSATSGKPAGRLWLILWAVGVLMALWWPVALFTTEGDPVVALAWFVYYGPSSLLLAAAIPLRPLQPLSPQPARTSTEQGAP